MTDTSDFVSRLRTGDKVRLKAKTRWDPIYIEGVISKAWSNGLIKCDGFVIRAWDFKINDDILAIRYSKLEEKESTND